MREAVLSNTYTHRKPAAAATTRKNYEKRWTLILSFSVLTAFALAGAGFIISGLAYLDLIEHARTFSRCSAILLVASAPLFALSAHCLDKIRFEKKRLKKIVYSRKFNKI